MTLPDWLLLVSALLAVAVPLSVVATRVRLPLTVVLAVAGVITAWVGGRLELASPQRGHRFEDLLIFVFLPIRVFEAALGLSTRAVFRNLLAIVALAVPALPLVNSVPARRSCLSPPTTRHHSTGWNARLNQTLALM